MEPIKTHPFNFSKKSPTGPTERTPKPEYLIALATYLGVRWQGPIQFWIEIRFQSWCIPALSAHDIYLFKKLWSPPGFYIILMVV